MKTRFEVDRNEAKKNNFLFSFSRAKKDNFPAFQKKPPKLLMINSSVLNNTKKAESQNGIHVNGFVHRPYRNVSGKRLVRAHGSPLLRFSEDMFQAEKLDKTKKISSSSRFLHI